MDAVVQGSPSQVMEWRDDQNYLAAQFLEPNVLVIEAEGFDRGVSLQLMKELNTIADTLVDAEAFVNLTAMKGASWEVSQRWANWLKEHRPRIKRLVVLVGSKSMQITVSAARAISTLGQSFEVVSSPQEFRDAFQQRMPGWELSM